MKRVILSENQAAAILNENRVSKNINLARKYCISKGWSVERAQQVIDAVRHDIPNARIADCKFLLGVTRMFVDGELQNSETIMKLNKALKYVSSPAHIGEYDSNLNGMSAQDFISRFSTMAAQDLEADMERSNNAKHTENKAYRIVRINDGDEAEPYGRYTDWCVTDPYGDAYNSYTHGGLGVFYFCLKDGFENVPMEEGENCPLDEYGLSMIAVSVNEDGSCNTITCRWNHDNGGNDHVMEVEQLEKLIGRGFYQTFKPRTKEEIKAKRMEILDDIAYQASEEATWNGVKNNEYAFGPLFDEDDENAIKVFRYRLDDNLIIVDEYADPVIEDFFDDAYMTTTNGVIIVEKNGKNNIVAHMSDERGIDFRFVSDTWYSNIIPANASGYFIVMNSDKLFNVLCLETRSILFSQWFDAVSVYDGVSRRHGNGSLTFAITLMDGGYNIFPIQGGSVGSPMLSNWRSEIKMGPSGIFIMASPEGAGPIVYGKPVELYALNFDKFPYNATHLNGWEGGYYKIVCSDRTVYVDDDTRNGWKIMKEIQNDQPAGGGARHVAEGKSRNIIISEAMADELCDIAFPTRFKFGSHVRKFLAGLLEDPCGTDVDDFFRLNRITKDDLLGKLEGCSVIKKTMRIDDHDADGKPHTARMVIKYTVPKSRFNEKLGLVYDTLFGDGAKVKVNEEGGAAAGGGGATSCSGVDGNGFGSGEYVQPLFGGITVRRNGGARKKGRKRGVGGNPYTESLGESAGQDVIGLVNSSMRRVMNESRGMLCETEHPGMETDESSAVYIYAKDSGGRWCVLAAKRSPKYTMGGKWNPPMGHRTKGESFLDCAQRECKEESGLDISDMIGGVRLAGTYDWGREYVLVIGDASAESVKLGNGDDENGRFEWVPVGEIHNREWAWSCKEHAVSNFRRFVEKYGGSRSNSGCIALYL